MKTTFTIRKRRGYTLIELSIAMGVGLMVGAMLLGLANQQFSFLRIYAAQNFLNEEAPVINSYLTRLVGQAERFRLHQSLEDAQSGGNPVMSDANTLVLTFQQPDGTAKTGVLCFHQPAADMETGLYYYPMDEHGEVSAPEWSLSNQPHDVRFSIEEGILRTRITGPNGELITYSGTMQQ